MNHPLWITQRQALIRLAVTGLSERTRQLAIDRMEKRRDGQRDKVRSIDVANIIAEVAEIRGRAVQVPDMRPVSRRQKARAIVRARV